MQLAMAALHPRPTRSMPMLDGRTLGVAAAVLTSGEEAAVIVPPSLLDAFAIARADLEANPGAPLPLTLVHRADGHLQLHAVDTRAVWIDGGASSASIPLEVPPHEAGAALARAA